MFKALHFLVKKLFALLSIFCFPLAYLLRIVGVRVLEIRYESIGHLAHEPDIYYKDKKVQKKWRFPILMPHWRFNPATKKLYLHVANRTLLNCWKQHYFVIQNPFLYFFLLPILGAEFLKVRPVHYFAPEWYHLGQHHKNLCSVYLEYEKKFGAKGRFTHLIKMKPKDVAKGERLLHALNIPKDAWYVCFNCREPGYYESSICKGSSPRNSSIENLELALLEIIKRGGWCIRVGSPRMKEIPQSLKRHEKIVDYPHTEYASEFMDIFLLSSCHFYMGNNSGITNTAQIFGKHSVLTNCIPFGQLSSFANEIVLYKLHRSKQTKQLLSFSACFQSLLTQTQDFNHHEEFGVEVLENTPEEIKDAVVEMLDRLEGKLIYSEQDKEQQRKFLSLKTSLNTPTLSRVGKAYLKKYEHLMR